MHSLSSILGQTIDIILYRWKVLQGYGLIRMTLSCKIKTIHQQLLLIEFKLCGEDIIHQVVKVGAINQPLSLVAWVHGGPAKLVISHLSLHEAPHRSTHYRYRFLAWEDQELAYLIKCHLLTEELTCEVGPDVETVTSAIYRKTPYAIRFYQ